MTYGLMCDICKKVEKESDIKGWFRLSQIEYTPYNGLDSVAGTSIHICPDCMDVMRRR